MMDIALVTRTARDSEIAKGLGDRLNTKLHPYGATLTLFEESRFVYHLDQPTLDITYDGMPFHPEAFALLWLGEAPDLYLAQIFESLQRPVINAAAAYFHNADKVKLMIRLKQAGICIPRTLALAHPSQLAQVIQTLPPPYVVKDPQGEGGIGVLLAESDKALHSLMDYLWHQAPERVFLVQEFIDTRQADGDHQDIRCTVIGDRIISLERRSHQDFRVNVSRGGGCHPVTITTQEEAQVRQCASLCGLDVMGIDFLRDHEGTAYFTEINHTPMLLWQNDTLDEAHLEALAQFLLTRARAKAPPI